MAAQVLNAPPEFRLGKGAFPVDVDLCNTAYRNDEMLDDKFAATGVVLFGGNGVALNLAQKAEAKGLTVMRVADGSGQKLVVGVIR